VTYKLKFKLHVQVCRLIKFKVNEHKLTYYIEVILKRKYNAWRYVVSIVKRFLATLRAKARCAHFNSTAANEIY